MNMDRERDIIIGKEVREGGKIDQHCQVNLRSRTGHLEITQKVDGNSIASLLLQMEASLSMKKLAVMRR